jgi:hypothetical protein
MTMTTAADNRRANLEILVKEAGSLDLVAQHAGTSPIYLSQIRARAMDSKTGRPREMGSNLARRLEQAVGKPIGWMDLPHTEPGTPSPQQFISLETALPVVLDAMAKSQARAELRQLLPMLVDTNATAYRQRLYELLCEPPEVKVTRSA